VFRELSKVATQFRESPAYSGALCDSIYAWQSWTVRICPMPIWMALNA